MSNRHVLRSPASSSHSPLITRHWISNRHPCRLETTLNPCASMKLPLLIVTKSALKNERVPLRASGLAARIAVCTRTLRSHDSLLCEQKVNGEERFFSLFSSNEMARPEGFEPPTLCLEGRRSFQLSYGRTVGELLQFTALGVSRATDNYSARSLIYSGDRRAEKSISNRERWENGKYRSAAVKPIARPMPIW